jgi:large repetitive protein
MPLPARRSTLALLASCAAALAGLWAPSLAAAAEGQIIVRYEPGADAQDRAEARGAADVVRDEAVALPRAELVTPEPGTTITEAVADLEQAPEVAYAEPDQPRRAFSAPSDLRFAEQWALHNTGQPIWLGGSSFMRGTAGDDIDVMPVWEAGMTGTTAKVAVVDSGVALDHPDLRANLLAAEGYDFVGDDPVPADRNGHGTHVAGTIGASGNNGLGVTGVAWNAQILPIRVLNADGDGTLVDVIAAYEYADDQGAKVVNLSLGGDHPSQAEYDALRAASDVLFVAAAGNDGADVDRTDSYPCAYDLPNVVCVAATDGNDGLASFSNYGATSVDLAAPGDRILSTYYDRNSRSNAYAYLDGTSMATPHVAGAAALLLGQHPELTPWQAREMLLAGAHPEAGLAGKVATGGRLDVLATLNAAAPPATETPVADTVAPQARLTVAQPSTPATPVTPTPTPAPAPAAPARTTTPVSPAPAPVAVADRTAPALAFRLASRQRLRTVLARGLRVSATCSERCTARVELTVDGRTAKRLRLSKRATKARVAVGTATISRGATKSITVRFTAKAKRALGRARSVKVAVRVTATDAARNGRTRARSVTLAR